MEPCASVQKGKHSCRALIGLDCSCCRIKPLLQDILQNSTKGKLAWPCMHIGGAPQI